MEWNFNPSLTRSFIFGSRENCKEDKNKLLGVLFLCLTCNLLGRCKCQKLNKCSPRRHFTTFTSPKKHQSRFHFTFYDRRNSFDWMQMKQPLAKHGEERTSWKLVFESAALHESSQDFLFLLCSLIDWKLVERVINATGF